MLKAKRTKTKKNSAVIPDEPQSATVFTRQVYDQIQSWRGDIRLDDWHQHFLSSLAHMFWSHDKAIYLSQKQVEKLEEIAEIISGYAPPSRPLHADDIAGEIVDWANEGDRPKPPAPRPPDDHWHHAQRAAKRRIAAGAPLASNLWWERKDRWSGGGAEVED